MNELIEYFVKIDSMNIKKAQNSFHKQLFTGESSKQYLIINSYHTFIFHA